CQRRLMLQLWSRLRHAVAPAAAGPCRRALLARQSEERPAGECHRSPDERVLEEAGVEEGVHEERQEDRTGAEAEGTVAPRVQQEEPRRAGEQRRIGEEPDDA